MLQIKMYQAAIQISFEYITTIAVVNFTEYPGDLTWKYSKYAKKFRLMN